MQSGLVRSDYNHIVFGAFPMIFFAGVVLFSFQSHIVSALAAMSAVACSFAFAQPASQFQPSNMRYRLARMRHPIRVCPPAYLENDRVCYPDDFAQTLGPTVQYLQQHTQDRDPVLIFPYQYMFAVAADRDVAAGVEQSFLANGPYLSQYDIDGMARAHARVGLYFADAGASERSSSTLSLPIDDVSNFTRSPESLALDLSSLPRRSRARAGIARFAVGRFTGVSHFAGRASAGTWFAQFPDPLAAQRSSISVRQTGLATAQIFCACE